jgi:hypothetical protein
MDLKKLFNSYLTYGVFVKINGLNSKDEWKNKISQQEGREDIIPGGWITSRIFYNGKVSTDLKVIYDYLYSCLGMGGITNPNFANFRPLLQTARLVNNNPCTIEILAQVAYNVGQMLASIDFYSLEPSALHYISVNKLNKVESYIALPACGGAQPVLDIYRKYIDMTPYKGTKLVGGSCSSTTLNTCKCGSDSCDNCNGSTIINVLI